MAAPERNKMKSDSPLLPHGDNESGIPGQPGGIRTDQGGIEYACAPPAAGGHLAELYTKKCAPPSIGAAPERVRRRRALSHGHGAEEVLHCGQASPAA